MSNIQKIPTSADSLSRDVQTIRSIGAVPRILEVVCRTTGMGFAAVARVTEDRWIACEVRDDIHFGLVAGGELKVKTTICNEIRENKKAVVIDHVANDPDFCGHPTPAMYGFQSYISVPIYRGDGAFFGTLCAIDPKPAKLNTPETIGMFELFADLIGHHLETEERLENAEEALINAQKSSELRDQFIAVLGHDLRNPLASIDAGMHLIGRMKLDEKTASTVTLIKSSVTRMNTLINNVLDFARGRLGGGIAIERNSEKSLTTTLEQVVGEFRNTWPSRVIEADIAKLPLIACDAGRIAQLLSNLIGNALTHGSANMPVRVRAHIVDDVFELSVANHGKPIPTTLQAGLFQPFFRGTPETGGEGLGLGLYIVAEIARAHCATLDVSSTSEETRFTFRMPLV